MFISLQLKSENNEISTKSVDIRGLISAIETMEVGLSPYQAILMGIANKSFDDFERQIVIDTIKKMCIRDRIYVTHSNSVSEKYSDRIIKIVGGKIDNE